MNFKRKASVACDRLQKVLMNDKTSIPTGFNGLIKSDITELLKSYFGLYEGSVEVHTDFESGLYKIEIRAVADHIKHIGTFIPENG
jgi:septum formation topological specificity factor MinE